MKMKSSKLGTSASGTDFVRPLEAHHGRGRIVIRCSDGRTVAFDAKLNPVLRKATPAQRNRIECRPFGLHWPDLDEDLSLQGILEGRYGRRGGARPGAGRKPSGRVPYSTRIKPALIEWIKVEAQNQGKDECSFLESLIAGGISRETGPASKVLAIVEDGRGGYLHRELQPDAGVAALRAKLGLSKGKFAALLGVSTRTFQEWEQGRSVPTGAARVLLRVARTNPKAVLEAWMLRP